MYISSILLLINARSLNNISRFTKIGRLNLPLPSLFLFNIVILMLKVVSVQLCFHVKSWAVGYIRLILLLFPVDVYCTLSYYLWFIWNELRLMHVRSSTLSKLKCLWLLGVLVFVLQKLIKFKLCIDSHIIHVIVGLTNQTYFIRLIKFLYEILVCFQIFNFLNVRAVWKYLTLSGCLSWHQLSFHITLFLDVRITNASNWVLR